MAKSNFTMVGNDRLDRQLAALGDELQAALLLHALVAGALLVVNDAKRRARVLTGNLRRSLHVGGQGSRGGLEGNTTGGDIGGEVVRSDYIEVLVGTNVEYARRLELGFIGTDSLGRVYHQGPSPYLRPALHGNRKQVRQEIGESMVDLMKAVASR